MSYFTEGQLREYASRLSTTSALSESTRSFSHTKNATKTTVFLSHSSKDHELVDGFIGYLAAQGFDVYIDKNDKALPRITSGETATAIRDRIAKLDWFIMLATRNALASRWVPWELGVADVVKGYDGILIVPVTASDNYGAFRGSEYLQVYQHGELSDFIKGAIRIDPPSNKTGFKYLKDIL